MFGFVKKGVLCVCIAVSLTVFADAGAAYAASTWWHLTTNVRPATIAPGGEGAVVDEATNLGYATATGGVTLSDVLPAGVTVAEDEEGKPEISFFASQIGSAANLKFLCQVAARRVTCTFPASVPVPAYENLTMRIEVKVGASSATNLAEVSGGGALPVKVSRQLPVSASVPAFGVEEYTVTPEEADGAIDAQAGSHPFQFTTTLALNQTASNVAPPALPRNLTFQLPAGLVGNATSVPQCSEVDFNTFNLPRNHCPGDTAVGVATVTFYSTTFNTKLASWAMPLFNLVPAHGEPARFGFNIFSTQITLDTSVRSGADYGVTVRVKNISQTVNFLSTSVTIWGTPGDARHDGSRGWECVANGTRSGGTSCIPEKQTSPVPFLTLPTSCAAPFASTVEMESWPFRSSPEAEPTTVERGSGEYSLIDGFGRSLDMTGCNQLNFAPFIEAAADVQETSKPSGLSVHVRMPQEASSDGAGLSGSDVRDITVALPPGVGVNPAGAGGLEACSESEIGYLPGQSTPPDKLDFSSTLPEPLLPGLNLNALGFCPNASKIGTAKITTPLIANPLNGFVYLAAQNANPFGGLLAMYIVAEDPVSGTLVKLPGEVSLCQAAGEVIAGESCAAAGQLITTFENEPQVPFEDAELHFFGGERAPLSTPARCGQYTTRASFVPWSGSAPANATSTFAIEHGAGGGPCPGQTLPFAPTLTAGATDINAGGFTPLTTTIGREDGNQDMQSVQLHFPPGLSGVLAGMKLCPEAQANAGTCGAESQIGETTVSAGVGSQPVSVKGGKVFLTEKYDGAPFGLSIVDPVKTGPFDLEHDSSRPATNMPACDCVVVRAKVEVDPSTAALTVVTDPSGPHAIPHLLDGIPVQIQKVNVLVNRPGFTFNPTSCDPMKIEGAITSDEGSSSPVNVPFQVANCAMLKFKPGFKASTSGKTSRKNGASLHVKLTYPKAPFGSQANIRSVKVELPKALPSRLSTLNHACLDSVFNQDPASCPSQSRVGSAKAVTPVLPVPLDE